MSTTDNHLPFDIQTEIIKRIPDVKSLIRFRSVSKPWKSLIDSSKFISAYKSPNHRFLLTYSKPGCGCGYESVADDDSFPSQHPLLLPKSRGVLVGISQGLLCFYNFHKEPKLDNPFIYEQKIDNPIKCKIVIWNPSIRKSVTFDFRDHSHIVFKVFGFGVCPRTKDPKLVNISDSEIFTLSSRTWRSLSINVPNFNAISFRNRVVIDINGILYWHGLGITNYHFSNPIPYNRFITFDLTSEEFGEVCLPDELATSHSLSISNLNESLVVLEFDEACKVCDVWIMEHGASKSFKKLFTVKTPFCYIIKGFRRNGQPIIEAEVERRGILQVYDPCNGQINDHDLGIVHCFTFASSYIETLLLLDQIHEDGHMTRCS